jgi:hypothetical protein
MPIDPIAIQRRLAEQGRIRLGEKVPVGTTGKTRPGKLDRFRFTSPNQRLITDLATLYGGTARAWDNGGMSEFEVVSDAREIPVIVVKGGVSQWFETWSGGGCVHRCTGVENDKGEPCNPNDPNHVNAKPTTRLSLMLPELDTMGVWRLESHGYNAAAEIPMIAELAMHVGDLVPARLQLVERRALKDGKTSRFVVPVLDLDVNTRRLVELAGGRDGAPMLEAAGAPSGQAQIGSAPAAPAVAPGPARPDVTPIEYYQPLIDAANTRDELNTLWQSISEAQHTFPDVVHALKERAQIIDSREQQAPADPPPNADDQGVTGDGDDADETVDAELVDDELVDDDARTNAAWQDAVTAAGRRGMTTTQLVESFEQWAAIPVSDGDAVTFRRFIAETLT